MAKAPSAVGWREPNSKFWPVSGCTVYVYTYTNLMENIGIKLHKKAQKLRFIGYTETAGNYRVWDKLSLTTVLQP